jgi:hypothetical protein
MDEGRKRVLWICATILAGPQLQASEDGKNSAVRASVTQDAIAKAERIIRQIATCAGPLPRLAAKISVKPS